MGPAWPPDAIAMSQGKPGLKASGKGCTKKQFSPAAKCVFPSTSLTFCEALPAHRGMPVKEEDPQRTRMLGSSSKRREQISKNRLEVPSPPPPRLYGLRAQGLCRPSLSFLANYYCFQTSSFKRNNSCTCILSMRFSEQPHLSSGYVKDPFLQYDVTRFSL